jgi:tight adherence protein B
MNLTILIGLFFLVTLILFISVLYVLVEAPATDKAFRARLRAIQQASAFPSGEAETELLRREVLSRIPAFNRILYQIPFLIRLNLFLQQAAVEITVGMLLALSFALALALYLVGLLLNWSSLLALLLAAFAGAVPFILVAIKRQRRFAKFEEQFPDAIDFLARAVRAGHAFTTGLQLIGSEMPEPVAAEFRRTFDQQNLGLPLRDALQNLLARVPLPDVHIFVTALLIQRETGGNLAEILDNLARVIRDRFKLMRQVKVYTAQGRMSLYLLVAMTPGVALVLYLMNRSYMSRLFTDPLGQKALAAAVILQLFGYLVIRKITQPKV